MGIGFALSLSVQFGRELVKSALLILQCIALTLGLLTGIAIGFPFSSQNKLIVSVVFVTDNGCGFQCIVIALQRVRQFIHSLHGADHGGEIIVRQYLKGVCQDFLHHGGTEILGQLRSAHFD